MADATRYTESVYQEIVRAKLERKRLWRAFLHKDAVGPFICCCYDEEMTEKQCVRQIRKMFERADRISLYLTFGPVGTFLSHAAAEAAFVEILMGIVAGRNDDDIGESIRCNPKYRVL